MTMEYKVGDFGTFHFILRTKGVKTEFTVEGAEIIETDRWYVLLRGMDGVEYLPRRDNIKSFQNSDKPKAV
jgi:hypothetical protein